MPEYINNSYSRIFQLTWYCGIYKDDRHGLCPHDACNSKQEIRHIHESHDKTQKHRKIKKKFEQKNHRNSDRRLYLVRIGKSFMKVFCMEFKCHLYGVLKKKCIVFQKANIRNSLRCLALELLPSQLTSWLEEPASVRDYTHKIFISWVWLEARVWSFDTMVNGTEETLDTGPLGGRFTSWFKKRNKLCFLPGLNIVTQGYDAWSNGYHLDIWEKARELHSSQFSSKT